MPATIPLPFGPDDPSGVYVPQSFGGTFSHIGTLYYSVDFLLGFDAPVLSQGHGTVVEVVENVPDGKSASEGDSDPSMGKSGIGNFVTVQYDEGFYATYQHLKQDGVEVNEGDTVTPHDILGHVGNTGYRTDTHLHVTYGDEPIQWIAGIIANGSLSANNNIEPVLFATPEDSDGILDAGKYYHGDNIEPPISERIFSETEPNNTLEQANHLGKLWSDQKIHISGHLNGNSDPYDYFDYTATEPGSIAVTMYEGDQIIYNETFIAQQANEPFYYYGWAEGNADFSYDTYISLSPAPAQDILIA